MMHDEGCSVTGGPVYRGSRLALAGHYLYADFCSGRIRGLDTASDRPAPRLLADTDLAIAGLAEDAAGEVYLLDLARGAIYMLDRP